MGYYAKTDTRGVRETERPVSFIPKGALTHHPEGAVVFPAEIVRSARRMRLLREPYGQCHDSMDLLSLSTQSAVCFAHITKQGTEQNRSAPTPPARTNLPPAALFAVMGIASNDTHFLFAKKKQKPKAKGR